MITLAPSTAVIATGASVLNVVGNVGDRGKDTLGAKVRRPARRVAVAARLGRRVARQVQEQRQQVRVAGIAELEVEVGLGLRGASQRARLEQAATVRREAVEGQLRQLPDGLGWVLGGLVALDTEGSVGRREHALDFLDQLRLPCRRGEGWAAETRPVPFSFGPGRQQLLALVRLRLIVIVIVIVAGDLEPGGGKLRCLVGCLHGRLQSSWNGGVIRRVV